VGSSPTARTNPPSAGRSKCPTRTTTLFGEDGNEAVEDFRRLTDLLFHHVSEFAEEEDVSDDVLSLLLLQLSATTRMMAYALSVAKPSSGGLKLDLDRFRREADDLIRAMKQDADGFIARAKESIAAAAADEPDEDES
jgi:hypothetical protein